MYIPHINSQFKGPQLENDCRNCFSRTAELRRSPLYELKALPQLNKSQYKGPHIIILEVEYCSTAETETVELEIRAGRTRPLEQNGGRPKQPCPLVGRFQGPRPLMGHNSVALRQGDWRRQLIPPRLLTDTKCKLKT